MRNFFTLIGALFYCLSSFGQTISPSGSATFCAGGSVKLTVSGAAGGSGFQWQKDGNNISGATSNTYDANSNGSYTVVITGGTNTTLGPVAVSSTTNPVSDFSFTSNTCSGNNTVFTSNISSGTAPFNYSWDFGDASTSTNANPTHPFTSLGCGTGNFQVKLSVKDSKGCVSNEVTKTVSVLQAPDVQLSDPNDAFTPFNNCRNTPNEANPNYTVTVANASPSASCISSYNINWGDGSSQNNVSFPLTHTYTKLGAFDLSVTGLGTNGCSYTKKYIVANQSNPAGSLGTLGSTTNLCAPATVPFTISNWTLNSPGTVYVLDFGDGTSVTLNHPLNPGLTADTINHVYNTSSCPSPSYTATLRVINACDNTPYTAGNIQIRIKPTADFDINSTPACVNRAISFNNTTTAGSYGPSCNTGATYDWDFGDGSAHSTQQSPSHAYSSPGVYNVSLTSANPCGSTTVTKQVCITAAPAPAFTIINTGCAPFTATVVNSTNTFSSCQNPTYQYDISYNASFCGTQADYSFVNGTSATSENPSIQFNNPGTYTITQRVTNACGIFTSTQTVTVKKVPVVTINLPSYSCGVVNITPSATIQNCSNNSSTYAWTFTDATPASANSLNPGNVSFATTGIHPISLSVTNECGTSTDKDTVVVSVAPDVVAPADQSVCGGSSAGPYNFTNTIGTPSFNWVNNNPAIGLAPSGTGNISSFTAINNSNAPITARIIVTPSVSNCTGVPDTFFITVNPKPAPPQVSATATYCQLSAAAPLSATPAGTNTLTWYNNAALTGGSNTIPTPLTNAPGTSFYYVTQTNSFNCRSDAAVITVNVNPTITGNNIGNSQNICANTAPALLSSGTVSGGNGSYTYQWQSSTDGGNTWANIGGTNGNDYQPGILTDTIQYRRIVNSVPCSDTSNAVTINVAGALTNFNISADQIICEGLTPALLTGQSPTGGGGNYTFQWQSSTDNNSWNNVAGAVSQDYQPGALTVTTWYRRIVNTPQCSATSNAVKITVNPTPAGSIIAVAPFICVADAGSVSFTATAGTAAFNVVLVTTNPGGTTDTIRQTINSNTGNVQVINPNSAAGIYNVKLVEITDGKGCISNTISAPLNIAILNPIVNSIVKDSTICNGQAYTISNGSLSGGDAMGIPAVYSYQWESAPSGTNSWQNIPGATNADLTVSPSSATCYRRKVRSNGKCEVVSNSVCVSVDPGISNNSIASSQQVCINTNVNNITGNAVSGGNGNYVYRWYTSTDSVSWSAVANTLSYQPPVYTAEGVHYFRRDVASGNCTSSSNVVTINVHPDAKALFSASSTSGCSPFDLSKVVTVNVLPNNNGTYKWYADGVLFGTNSQGLFPGYTINNAGTPVTIKLLTNSQYGCKPDSMEQQFVTVQTAVANFTKNKSNGCGPLDVTFSNTSSIINNNVQFFWNFGNGISSNLAQPGTITFNSSPYFNDTTYYITLKAFNGCDTTVWKDSVTVRSNPNARFGVVTTFGCSPFTVQISNTSLGGPSTYYWDFGNGHYDTTLTNGTLSYTYNTGNIVDTFPLLLSAVNECGVDTQVIKIRIAPNVIKPQININANELFGCTPHIVVFSNATSGATSYTWDFGDGTQPIITNNTEATITHTFNQAGVFNILIKISNGCSDTSVTRQVTVYEKPIAAFTTNANVYCLADTVRVNNNSQDASNYRWFWGDGQSGSGLNPNHVYSTAGDYSITLRAEKTNNSGVVCYDTVSKNITVLVKPDVRIQTNVKNINCAPFHFSSTAPGIINESVTWYIIDTTVSPSVILQNGASADYIFNKPGTFTVKMIARNALSCADSSIVTFTVRGTPVASFTPGNINICKIDTTISYTNTTTFNDNGPLSYRWLVNGVQQSTNGNFNYHYITPANTILPRTFTTVLIASNTVGCSDTATAVLQMNPVAKAQFTLANTNTCVPFVLPVTESSTYATKWRWYVNGMLTDTASNPVLTITQPSTLYNIMLVADNVYGCKPDSLVLSFTTRSKPKAIFTLSDTLGCTGRLSVATTNATTGANFYTWDWGDNTGISNFRNPSHVYNSNGQYLVSLVASDGVCRDTATQLVKVSVKPVVNFAADNLIDCDTTYVNFTNLTQNAAGYTWYFGDGATSIAANPSHAFNPNPNPYTVKLVADDGLGCKDSLVKANLITAKVPPPGDFYISPTPVISYPNYTFSFNNLTPNSANYTYQWNLGDGSFANTRDVLNHKYSDTGDYTIQLIVLDAVSQCLDTTIKIARIDGFPGYLYVPNAICPGCIQTGLREFMPKGKGLAQYRLQIFTTWGELIFETTSLDADGAPNKSWDGRHKGTLVQQDVYVWRIDAKFKNGTEWLGMIYPGESRYKKTGTITVVK